MSNTVLERHAKPVPRYTSYPTAPHFHDGIDSQRYVKWLGEIPPETDISLYLHIPFCDRLCWFCGCHTKQVLRYDPIATYVPILLKEMATVSAALGGKGRVTALHLGGGSPSMLSPADLILMAAEVRRLFAAQSMEFSIEIDPNDMTVDRYDAFAAAGVTRISVGVQDFNPEVQASINRIQTFEQTRQVVDGMRQRGVSSVNLDVLYGLPHQTVSTVEATIDQVVSLGPDRVALFGYAHVPWMKVHQRLIDETRLPDVAQRLAQSQAAARRLLAAGYVAIGIDHFALPSDALALADIEGRLRRNFQGYTTDQSPVLIGLGASAISHLPQGYIQNATATGEYMRLVKADGTAVARGFELSADDHLRGWAIERLMCDFGVSIEELRRKFGPSAEPLVQEMTYAAMLDPDGIISFDGRWFGANIAGRPYVRSIASTFDTYFQAGTGRHSAAV